MCEHVAVVIFEHCRGKLCAVWCLKRRCAPDTSMTGKCVSSIVRSTVSATAVPEGIGGALSHATALAPSAGASRAHGRSMSPSEAVAERAEVCTMGSAVQAPPCLSSTITEPLKETRFSGGSRALISASPGTTSVGLQRMNRSAGAAT